MPRISPHLFIFLKAWPPRITWCWPMCEGSIIGGTHDWLHIWPEFWLQHGFSLNLMLEWVVSIQSFSQWRRSTICRPRCNVVVQECLHCFLSTSRCCRQRKRFLRQDWRHSHEKQYCCWEMRNASLSWKALITFTNWYYSTLWGKKCTMVCKVLKALHLDDTRATKTATTFTLLGKSMKTLRSNSCVEYSNITCGFLRMEIRFAMTPTFQTFPCLPGCPCKGGRDVLYAESTCTQQYTAYVMYTRLHSINTIFSFFNNRPVDKS